MSQPGGWLYNCLPYVGSAALHDLGLRAPVAAKRDAILKMIQTPLAIANCPSRRPLAAVATYNSFTLLNAGGVTVDQSLNLARSDYAGSVGDMTAMFSDGTTRLFWRGPNSDPGRINQPLRPISATECNGMVFDCSVLISANVRDGLGNTVLFGEKYVSIESYRFGDRGYDNEMMCLGMDNDVIRGTHHVPMQDMHRAQEDALSTSQGIDFQLEFGSAHPSGCNFAFCDGVVRNLSYNIDPTVFTYLGNRADGNVVSGRLDQ